MDKQQAEQALNIIRQVIQNTHEDLVAHNWGLIWIVHSFTNGAAFASVGFFVERRELGLAWYLAPLAALAALNLTLVAVLMQRDRGVRSYVEWQVHGIWTTFMVFSLAGLLLIHLSGASSRLFCPLMALNSGIGFAMMGVVFYGRLLAFAALFLAVAVAAPFLTSAQWYLLAAAWWISLMVPGVAMHCEKLRRQRQGETRVL